MGSIDISDYHWQDVPVGYHRPVRVVCIGAGYSGLMMSIIAKEKMEHHQVSFQVYEKNNDLGGTWLLNRSVRPESIGILIPELIYTDILAVNVTSLRIITHIASTRRLIGPDTTHRQSRYLNI